MTTHPQPVSPGVIGGGAPGIMLPMGKPEPPTMIILPLYALCHICYTICHSTYYYFNRMTVLGQPSVLPVDTSPADRVACCVAHPCRIVAPGCSCAAVLSAPRCAASAAGPSSGAGLRCVA
ncbi:MAG: hypothetical protein MI924_26450 [Chloroflexales bacterium]|nr:hypothetical protein [Chloroflexales bacterium]